MAIVLPNGPEMATAFVTVAQSATTAPLNPAYKEEEFAFYLEDLKARAIILEAGYDGPARAAAKRFDMTVLELTASEPAGSFTLSTDVTGEAPDAVPSPDDVALILHTSGTTSRPKIVPLLQSNVAASAQEHRGLAGAHARGLLPERHAALSHPRTCGGGQRVLVRRRLDQLCAGL